ncbi:peptide deformylase [Peptoniphilus asaccharolyticus DSM 20463]|uniref:Peptide deformylase n=1 Tax=Peptoniphilus asaccharolyticus DSM 20463 TaxID=573058 RepID=A0A1W1VCJ8_PEPAS|nr:peptide deformylase [Peptoniphilus asaccharolyticus]MBL7575594.1 peptide deformylase [Peptoniphilus asaccharolyticus]SMB91092.1 peptide deformylase [Peptoniphilus asaccharolyticus DSM 20463]
MIRKIVRDTLFLRQKSERATKEDVQIIEDLKDTLKANSDRCVGMAANMIGYKKNIIIVSMGIIDVVMVNPVIKTKSKPYNTEEGCLSLDGVRSTLRYDEIEVEYEDVNFKKRVQKYNGFIAQTIQHEMDHLNGILI